MQIKNIMNNIVEVVPPDTPIGTVATKMRQSDCGCILVEKASRLLGMITDHDIVLPHAAETTAEQVMSSEILYCRDSDAADDVIKIMVEHKVRRLLVLDVNKKLVGIVKLEDFQPGHSIRH